MLAPRAFSRSTRDVGEGRIATLILVSKPGHQILRANRHASPNVSRFTRGKEQESRVLSLIIARPRTPPGVGIFGMECPHTLVPRFDHTLLRLCSAVQRGPFQVSLNEPSNSARRRAARPAQLSSTVPEPRHKPVHGNPIPTVEESGRMRRCGSPRTVTHRRSDARFQSHPAALRYPPFVRNLAMRIALTGLSRMSRQYASPNVARPSEETSKGCHRKSVNPAAVSDSS